MPSRIKTLKPSTFETIDSAVFDWIDNVLDLHATTNEGWKKVPVLWLTAERAAQRERRRATFSEALVFPMISVERTSVSKTAVTQRPIPGNVFPVQDYRRGAFKIHRRINQEKTKDFRNADSIDVYGQKNFPWKDSFGRKIPNQKIVYQTITAPMPVYYDLAYTLNVRTDYQQQMNEVMQPFMVLAGGINQFVLEKDGYSYEAFLEDNYALDNNVSSLAEDEKKYETTITIKVLGFLVGSDKNQSTPKMVIREGPVELKFQRERIVLGDINEYGIEDDKEKEPLRPRHKESFPFDSQRGFTFEITIYYV